MPKGWLNLEGVTDTQVFENEPAFNFGLSRTQRLYGFVGCLAIGFVLSLLGSILLLIGSLASFALLYTIGIVVSLVGTGFLIGFGKQLKLMFKPVRVVATIVFFATIGLVFVGAFVIKIGVSLPCPCITGPRTNRAVPWHVARAVPVHHFRYHRQSKMSLGSKVGLPLPARFLPSKHFSLVCATRMNNSAPPFCSDIKPRCGNKWQNGARIDMERIMSSPGLWQAPNGHGNPDQRQLPPGFVTQFDTTYNTWFYINTLASPPRSQWLHPADHHDQNNPPLGGVNWNALGPAGATPGGGGYSPGPGPAYGQGGYDPNMQQGYPPPQTQHKSSSNTGAIVAAGAAGVVGGALIANALSDDDYQDGYEAGLEAAEEN
ncbi:Got1 domain-containing protein [Rhizoctonia solani AG-1 IA]|uniref:Protein transport protein SFT2 n=2 Tax=Rhizoctonia solani TaxID=456999 RepID=L8WTP9_THACA|nr:Got1 domain-containing protein [Rhizoctonia solani AG-1 IA]